MKKCLVLAVLTLAILVTPALAQEQPTVAQLQAIIAQLMAQVAALQGGGGGGAMDTFCHNFNQNLRIGDSGPEVSQLHNFLYYDASGQRENGYKDNFDEAEASSVVGFQEKYASDILAPGGLTRGTGYVGPSTRAKLNQLYGCKGGVVPSVSTFTTNTSQSVTAIGQPTIISASSKAAGSNEIFPGEPVYVTGYNLTGLLTAYIDASYSVPISSNTGSTVTFTAPTTLTSGAHKLYLVGKISTTNSVGIRVTLPTTKIGQPVIISVSSKGADNNQIVAGDPVYVNGLNFIDLTSAYIDTWNVPINSNTGNTVIFTAPSGLTSGPHKLYLVGKAVATDSVTVYVTVPASLSPSYSQGAHSGDGVGNGAGSAQPSLVVSSPNGGESYVSGDSVIHIKYNSANIVGQQLTAYLYSPTYGTVRSMFSSAASSGIIDMLLAKAGPDNPGQYKITLCANEVDNPMNSGKPLCDSSDNYFTITAPVTTAKPDLVVTDIHTGVDYLSGDNVNKYNVIVARVCNQGEAATPSSLAPTGYFYTQFLFPNGVRQYGSNWDENGRALGINQVVQPGQCFITRAALSTGLQLTNGNYLVKVTADRHGSADYDNRISESDENNNSLSENLDLTFSNSPVTP